MTTTEHTVKRPPDQAGSFATFGVSPQAKGSGARSYPHRLAPALICATALCALVGIAPSVASAGPARLFAGTFGGATSVPANPYPLVEPGHVAVDQATGDVYVSEHVEAVNRVEKFDSSGHLILMFGKGVNKTKVNEAGSTAAEQNVCTIASGDECQQGVARTNANGKLTPLEDPAYIAVDNSTGPSQGDVYVATDNDQTAGLVDKFDSSGDLIESWASAGQLDGSAVTGPVVGPFRLLGGIAVDSSGDLWVSESAQEQSHPQVFEFAQDAKFITGWTVPGASSGELAIDPLGDLYFRSPEGSVSEFASSGKEIGAVAPSKAEDEELTGFARGDSAGITGLALDSSTGDLYLDGVEGKGEVGVVKRYEPSSCHPVITEEIPQPGCESAESFGAGLISEPRGIAIDGASPTKPVYVAEVEHGERGQRVAVFSLQTVPGVTTTKPAGPTATSATLTGTVNPSGVELNEGLEGCRFEYVEAAQYEPSAANPYAQGQTVACDKSAVEIGKGTEPVEVTAAISGLQAGHTYHYRLVASNANDENASVHQPSFGNDLAFGPPLIESASALSVTATSATLQVQVDPEDLDTHVRIEYGVQAGVYTQSTAQVDAGAAGSSQTVSLQLQGLTPATSYHYRAVAENVLAAGAEVVLGNDHVFTTQATGPFALLDGRGWELVSPPDKFGAKLEPIGDGLIQASASGNAIAYVANSPTEPLPPGNANSQVGVLAARGSATWTSQDIPTPHGSTVGVSVGVGSELKSFSTDLARAVVQPFGAFTPSLSAEASEQTPFLRTNYLGSDPTSFCISSCFRPLVTGAAGFANVPSGTKFGTSASGPNESGVTSCPPIAECGPLVLGADPNADHVVLSSLAPLVEGAPAHSLYEWFGGGLSLISILPAAAGEGPAPTGPQIGLQFGDLQDTRNAISSDGSRIVWSEKGGKNHLYLRDLAKEETLQLDLVKGGGGKGLVDPHFLAASADDSRIFFDDEQLLTAGAGTKAEKDKFDIYECEVHENEEGELECKLNDLTPETAGKRAEALGMPGASEDGSYVYFIARGNLTGSAENEHGETAQGSEPNLYVRDDGVTSFVAVLSDTDEPDWAENGGSGDEGGMNLGGLTARVSSDGSWLAFMSQRSLTGYDNRDAVSGQPDEEVFLYHAAAAAGEAGKLICASCDPSGVRPHGVPYHQLEYGAGGLAFGRIPGFANSQLIAANVPAWSGPEEFGGVHQPRYLIDEGRLFFDSSDALVSHDSNGTGDVYEYEPPGVGSCATGVSSFAASSGGCLNLISSGTSKEESAFLDASESGDDVFFLTAAQLSKRDTDTSYDVYDARVGGGEVEPVKPVECQGDACQGFVEAPNDATPGSLIFSGPGNLKPLAQTPPKKTAAQLQAEKLTKTLKACKKDKSKRKRATCEKQARQKYGTSKAKKATSKRRAKS
jgi:hypothetical protein